MYDLTGSMLEYPLTETLIPLTIRRHFAQILATIWGALPPLLIKEANIVAMANKTVIGTIQKIMKSVRIIISNFPTRYPVKNQSQVYGIWSRQTR